MKVMMMGAMVAVAGFFMTGAAEANGWGIKINTPGPDLKIGSKTTANGTTKSRLQIEGENRSLTLGHNDRPGVGPDAWGFTYDGVNRDLSVGKRTFDNGRTVRGLNYDGVRHDVKVRIRK
jgi:hypothetical protein